eukprot:gene1156-618_t
MDAESEGFEIKDYNAAKNGFEKHRVPINNNIKLPQIGRQIDVLKLPGDQNAPVDFVILPGNPGIGEYYYRFAVMLQNGCKKLYNEKKVSVYVASWRTFPHDQKAFENVTNSQMYEISDIRDEHLSAIRLFEFVQSDSGRNKNLVVFSHSIGSWILLRALATTNLIENIHLAILAFPFLERQNNFFQIVVPRIFKWTPWIAVLFARLLTFLPKWVQAIVLKDMAKWAKSVCKREFTVCFKYFIGVRNLYITEDLALNPYAESAITDLENWGGPRPISVRNVVEKNKSKFLSLYCQGDHWAPIHHRDRLARLGMAIKTMNYTDNYHGFCVHEHQCENVADVVLGHLKTMHRGVGAKEGS